MVGELFFASGNDVDYRLDYVGDPKNVAIDLSQTQIWGASRVATLDAIQQSTRPRARASPSSA